MMLEVKCIDSFTGGACGLYRERYALTSEGVNASRDNNIIQLSSESSQSDGGLVTSRRAIRHKCSRGGLACSMGNMIPDLGISGCCIHILL